MKEKKRILMVDDHYLILEGYKSKLKQYFEEEDTPFVIHAAGNCDEAVAAIRESLPETPYDVVFLDINLPPSEDNQFLSGEDLGRAIREQSPATRLIVLTMHAEPLRLLNIIKNLQPEGLLVKSDVVPQEFIRAFVAVCSGEIYESQTVMRLTRMEVTRKVVLGDNDRKILYHLSRGVRTKDLDAHIPLSRTAIEKRKRALKEIMQVENEGDLALINKARELGFV